MQGKLFREWLLFLKERKLYSKFIIHYRAANASCGLWKREKPCFKLLNGCDYIMPDKSDSLAFASFICSLRTMEWYAPYMDWGSLGIKFGELKGYISKRRFDGYWEEIKSPEEKKSPNPNHRHRREIEKCSKWYDRFYIDTVKNRYRR